jgi:hypothetical protein
MKENDNDQSRPDPSTKSKFLYHSWRIARFYFKDESKLHVFLYVDSKFGVNHEAGPYLPISLYSNYQHLPDNIHIYSYFVGSLYFFSF